MTPVKGIIFNLYQK